MKEKREKLVKYFMDNPCLSQEIDYENNDVRLDYYTRWVKALSEDELDEEMKAYET